MDNNFITWLNSELSHLGWNNNDLAQRANVTPSAISMVLSGQRQPGVDFCKGLARALKMPAVEVFRKAGLLPPAAPDPEEDPSFSELLSYMRRLSAEDRRDVLNYALFRYRQSLASREANSENEQANLDDAATATA
jgi:transcriptional regulator with XRE-family HTH domain